MPTQTPEIHYRNGDFCFLSVAMMIDGLHYTTVITKTMARVYHGRHVLHETEHVPDNCSTIALEQWTRAIIAERYRNTIDITV